MFGLVVWVESGRREASALFLRRAELEKFVELVMRADPEPHDYLGTPSSDHPILFIDPN
jgi:hypothetical protein